MTAPMSVATSGAACVIDMPEGEQFVCEVKTNWPRLSAAIDAVAKRHIGAENVASWRRVVAEDRHRAVFLLATLALAHQLSVHDARPRDQQLAAWVLARELTTGMPSGVPGMLLHFSAWAELRGDQAPPGIQSWGRIPPDATEAILRELASLRVAVRL